jgi:hypothetical protein
MSSEIVERRQTPRRRGDPHAEKLVALVTEVLGALNGLSHSIHDLRKVIEEQNEFKRNG